MFYRENREGETIKRDPTGERPRKTSEWWIFKLARAGETRDVSRPDPERGV